MFGGEHAVPAVDLLVEPFRQYDETSGFDLSVEILDLLLNC
jgi:hypothetical protein